MKYDAYVVSTIQFSEKIKDVGYTDLGFIQKELSPHLEAEKPHFHLYLEFRDAPLGYEILYNVQQAVDKSRRIIILLTENFLKVCEEKFYNFQIPTFKEFSNGSRGTCPPPPGL